jgi:hypothetical protein
MSPRIILEAGTVVWAVPLPRSAEPLARWASDYDIYAVGSDQCGKFVRCEPLQVTFKDILCSRVLVIVVGYQIALQSRDRGRININSSETTEPTSEHAKCESATTAKQIQKRGCLGVRARRRHRAAIRARL